jgi:hypothetical protein
LSGQQGGYPERNLILNPRYYKYHLFGVICQAFFAGKMLHFDMGGKMELTNEQLEIIRAASKEIEFGRITIDFTGPPSCVVDIASEKRLRFQRHKKADPTLGEATGKITGNSRRG